MVLDMITMMVMGSFLAMASGTLLIVAQVQYARKFAVSLWIASDFVLAAGLMSLALGAEHDVVRPGAYVFLTFHPALIWASTRLGNGQPISLPILFAGPVAVAAAAMLEPATSVGASAITHGMFGCAYLLSAAFTTIFRAEEPRLGSRWPLGILCAVHGVTLAATLTILNATAEAGAAPSPLMQIAGEFLSLETFVFLLGGTIFVAAITRESREQQMKNKAETDGLTGTLNRRAFLEKGERLLERCRVDRAPCSAIVFDLDHFKAVNDTHGHGVGDAVLEIFTEVSRKSLRPNDLFGRIGGEEFAAILPGADLAAGLAMADRLRLGLREAAVMVRGRAVRATLSAGVSTPGPDETLEDLLRRADEALYEAKAAGRNRVLPASGDRAGTSASVVRIA
ncbi:GGDEF domain-containing protein [Afifella sp. IM 167]|uniref:GGDEF domain-containing protein n=1 Tax=Afifella sp. IM 167 TaxID=2033586 RepID=UPI001CCB5681|nr:GGDEF domain-containing protein [Afifella sp. IM 167]MBZ8133522.1 hypothetical protein [Afifella sp. IM 167]